MGQRPRTGSRRSSAAYRWAVDGKTVVVVIIWDPHTTGALVDLFDATGSAIASGSLADDGSLTWASGLMIQDMRDAFETNLATNNISQFASGIDRHALPDAAQRVWDKDQEQVAAASPMAYVWSIGDETVFIVIIWDPNTTDALVDLFDETGSTIASGSIADDGSLTCNAAANGCSDASDCTLASDHCAGCHCTPLAPGGQLDECTATTVQCLVDPCQNKTAARVEHKCVVQ